MRHIFNIKGVIALAVMVVVLAVAATYAANVALARSLYTACPTPFETRNPGVARLPLNTGNIPMSNNIEGAISTLPRLHQAINVGSCGYLLTPFVEIQGYV